MKYRESGMPDESLWDTFFDVSLTLARMDILEKIKTFVDIGCGYGTFLLPAAELVNGTVVGIDIELDNIEICKQKTASLHIKNLDLIHGDVTDAIVLKSLEKYRHTIDYIGLFNILHCEEPVELLKTVYRLLNVGGRVGVIHWKHEKTPRGPSLEIRPRPENIIKWAANVGLILEKQIDLPPYHYGLIFIK